MTKLSAVADTQSGLISRRTVFSLLAALGVAAPVTILAASETEAQTPGMQRREERREDRFERREDRRDDRMDRREDRRDDRVDRREERRDPTTGAGTTGSSPTAAPNQK